MRRRIYTVAYILCFTLLGSLLLFQNSFENYWLQRYHTSSPLTRLIDHLPAPLQNWLLKVNQYSIALQQQQSDLTDELISFNTQLLGDFNHLLDVSPVSRTASQSIIIASRSSEQLQLPAASQTGSTVAPSRMLHVDPKNHYSTATAIANQPLPKPVLGLQHKLFFVGDSMMQGVAPWVKRILYNRYKIASLDLSKQSTGLAYPKAFDWPEVVEETLQNDPSIKVMAIFLGANDPWNFPDPVLGHKKYLRFKSEAWEAVYRARVERILAAAQRHQVAVIWLGAPCMRKLKLNSAMHYLNGLYRTSVTQVNGQYVDTNALLGCRNGTYYNYLATAKGNVKVRLDDGIHFTVSGQRILANKILSLIQIDLSMQTNKEANNE